ncbi:MAG: DUF480 domain-containing protein [Acidimicrobiaceae bacterium]|nr:DUF480 domain-containing protein [Acidimicrobiaceae bacterium]
MDPLSPEQLRVLGVLIEKEATTPDQYPLTMNALVLACNQTSNRQPVVSYTADDVEPAIASLREAGLVRLVHSPSNRAVKYRHVAGEAWELSPGELAVLAVLALRGPQTVNELRTRTERYTGLEDLGGADGVLHRLKNRYAEPWVARLERRPGQREERWMHLLAGEITEELLSASEEVGERGPSTASRLAALEAQVAQLTEELAELKAQLSALLE